MRGRSDGKDFWDRIARKYASDPIKDLAGYRRTVESARQRLGPQDVVLEVGCGTGTTALALAPSVARIVATDISDEMIAVAREKAEAQGVGNASFSAVPLEKLPREERGFDAVLAFNILHLVGDRPAALRRLSSALKPGGLFISKTPCLTEMNPLLRIGVPVARLFGLAPPVAFFSAERLEQEMEEAGFAIVERARHGSGRKDPRIYLVARSPADRGR